MKRHVADRTGRRPTLYESDRHMIVSHRDAVLELELLSQPQYGPEPLRAALWISNGQPEMTYSPQGKWYLFHILPLPRRHDP